MDLLHLRLFLTGLVGIIILIHRTHGAAVKPPASENLSAAASYMKNYGWMPPPDPQAATLITEMELRRSIAQMQYFFGLPETGEIDAATIELMQKPRCGVPDVRLQSNRFRQSRYSIDPNIKWNQNELTYSFENYTPDMTYSEVRLSIESALKVWSDITPLKFREISSQGTADIEIMFGARGHGDEFTFDGEGGTLAHAFFPGLGIGGDAHFDEDELFLYNTDVNGIDLFTVAAHELGHSLGLGHSEEPTALMAPFYQGYNPNFQLHYDDILGIQTLYGSNPRPPPPPPPPPTTKKTDTATVAPVTRSPPSEPKPDPVCTTKFDAISTIRQEVFMFKGDHMWRLARDGMPYDGYPVKISLFWETAPIDITAVFEKTDGTIVFVKGSEYWEFNGLKPLHDRPKLMTDFGLPSSISVDAAASWQDESKIFFFFENQVWRYDETTGLIDEGFPAPIKQFWGNIGNNLGAVFRFKDSTYFVKSKRYWEYDYSTQQLVPGYPQLFSVDWLGCPVPPTTPGTYGDSGDSQTLRSTFMMTLFTAIVIYVQSLLL